MPYHIIKVSGGYKVIKNDGTYMSYYPLSLETAKAQLRALYSAMRRKE